MALGTSPKQDADRPDYKSKAYRRMAPNWKYVQDVFEGEDAIKTGESYLQKFQREQAAEYDKRLKWSPFYNVTQPMMIGVVGNVFMQPVAPQEAPPPLKELFSDIDCCGNDLDTFLRETFTNAVRDGHSAIMVDAPPPPETNGSRPSRAEVVGRRPYWVNYRADQILSVIALSLPDGRTVPGQIVLKETTGEREGLYGEKEVVRYRVLSRDPAGEVTYSLFQEVEKEGSTEKDIVPVTDEQNIKMDVSEIPVFPVYGRQTGFWESVPPYLGLARLNIQHFNEASLYQRARQYLVPMLWVKYPDKNDAEAASKITMGSNSFIKVWGEHGAVGLLESSSNSGPIADEITKLEKRMARLGIEKYAPDIDQSAKTAYEVGSDNQKQFSEVETMARNLSNAVESAFEVTAEFINAIQGRNTVSISDADKATLALNIPYDKLTFSAERLAELRAAVKDGLLSEHLYRLVYFEREEIPGGYTLEEEEAEIARSRTSPARQGFEAFLDGGEVG